MMQTVPGAWQTHYDSPRVGALLLVRPRHRHRSGRNGADGVSNAVVVRTRKMTASEKAPCATGAHRGGGEAFQPKR